MNPKERARFDELKMKIYNSQYPRNPAPTRQEIQQYESLLEKYGEDYMESMRKLRKDERDPLEHAALDVAHLCNLSSLPLRMAEERFRRIHTSVDFLITSAV